MYFYLVVLQVRSLMWVPLGLKQGIAMAAFLLEAPGKSLQKSSLFQLLEAAYVLRHMTPLTISLHPQSIPFSDYNTICLISV